MLKNSLRYAVVMTDSGRNGTTNPHLVCIVGHIRQATLEEPPALQLAQEGLLGVEADQGLQNVEGKGTADLKTQRPSSGLGLLAYEVLMGRDREIVSTYGQGLLDEGGKTSSLG